MGCEDVFLFIVCIFISYHCTLFYEVDWTDVVPYRYRKVRLGCSSSRTLCFKSQKPLKLALVGQSSGLESPGPRVQLILAGTEIGQLRTKFALSLSSLIVALISFSLKYSACSQPKMTNSMTLPLVL